jgi:hypothetical protein
MCARIVRAAIVPMVIIVHVHRKRKLSSAVTPQEAGLR